MFGYDQAFIGGTMALPSFQREFGILKGTPQYTSAAANISSIFQAGCFFGTIIGYLCTERFGHRLLLMSTGVVFVVGAILQVVADGKLSMMYAGRILTGLTVGASSMSVPVYIAESSPAPIRGRLVGLFEVWLQFAGVVGFWINYGVQQNLPSNRTQWQIPVSIQIALGALLTIFMFFQKESPRWLAKNNRRAEAAQVLAQVRNLDPSHQYVRTEIAEMELQLEHEAEMLGTGRGMSFWRDQFREAMKPNVRSRLLLAVSLKVFQNLTGLQAINYFSPLIFQSIGLKGTSTSLLATGVFGIVKMVTTNLTMFFAVDTIGRRPLLLAGSAGSMLCMYYLGAYSKITDSFSSSATSPDAGGYVAIVLVYVFVVFFALSWNGIPWIFASEVFPNRIRSLGMMVAMCATWLVQFAIVYSTPYMIKNIQYGMFFFFGACITISLVHVYLFIPETKGIALEHMDYLFDGSILAVKARKEADAKIAEHVAVVDADDIDLKA